MYSPIENVLPVSYSNPSNFISKTNKCSVFLFKKGLLKMYTPIRFKLVCENWLPKGKIPLIEELWNIYFGMICGLCKQLGLQIRSCLNITDETNIMDHGAWKFLSNKRSKKQHSSWKDPPMDIPFNQWDLNYLFLLSIEYMSGKGIDDYKFLLFKCLSNAFQNEFVIKEIRDSSILVSFLYKNT